MLTAGRVKQTAGEKEPVSRAKILISKIDTETGERKDYSPSETNHEAAKVQEESHAFLLRKILDHSGQGYGGELEIFSRPLWSLLRKLLSHCPDHMFRNDHTGPITIESPYESLILNWEKLEKAAEETPANDENDEARKDLKLLLSTISSGSGDAKLDKYFKTRESNREQKTVTFDALWTLFPPGALVFGRFFLGQDQLFLVGDDLLTWPQDGATKWTMLCLIYDWDGKMFKRKSLRLDIDSFEGSKPITQLPFYPLKDYPNSAELKKRLNKRGLDYKRICNAKEGSQMFGYKGNALVDKGGFSGIRGDKDEINNMTSLSDDHYSQAPNAATASASRTSTHVDSRVMVDFDSYFRFGPEVAMVGSLTTLDHYECMCQNCQEYQRKTGDVYRRRFDHASHQEEWEDEQYLLCPPRVLGYLLRDKRWAQLQVQKLENIPAEDPDHSWDRVKLQDGEITKTLVLDLIKGHRAIQSKENNSDLAVEDVVAKKGKGLVMLLYGPPGVGKTSTAETVAIAARKPLFSISVSDVGTKAKNVEANLEMIFALATSWQAILLIDEADVFLQRRGILMLTTNQIASFDVAVQSRIHVAIKYTKLSKEQIMLIFEGFLKPLEKKNCVYKIDAIREWIAEDVCNTELDGRQIRNIVTSALGLARAQHRNKLEKEHLKKIYQNVGNYKRDFLVQFERYKNDQKGMLD
ncbi:MAG: hypothetical protein Q9210_006700 [Variospora velana]